MAERNSTLAVFLLISFLGHAMASVMMVRREAPDTTAVKEDKTTTEIDAAAIAKGAEEKAPAETEAAKPAETEAAEPAAVDTEAGEEAAGETEKAGEPAEETEKAEGAGDGAGTEEGEESEEGSSEEDEDQPPDMGFQTGVIFGSPFVTLKQMQRYFFELERALHKIFENTLNEAAEDPNAKNSTTSEEVTVGGQKYMVNRTTFQEGDGNSSLIIKSISIVPAEERRKRSLMEMV